MIQVEDLKRYIFNLKNSLDIYFPNGEELSETIEDIQIEETDKGLTLDVKLNNIYGISNIKIQGYGNKWGYYIIGDSPNKKDYGLRYMAGSYDDLLKRINGKIKEYLMLLNKLKEEYNIRVRNIKFNYVTFSGEFNLLVKYKGKQKVISMSSYDNLKIKISHGLELYKK